jgi:hypothetical protein
MVSASFSNLAQYFQAYGVMDFLLPFILVFTIIFAVAGKLPLFGGPEHKSFRIVIALVMGLLFVVPHITGTYPLGYDPVQIMNESLPSISLLSIAAIMVLLLLGIFGTEFSDKAMPFIAIVAISFVVYIFGASLGFWRGPYEVFYWWSSDVTELMVVLAIFGLTVWFITKDDTPKAGAKSTLETLKEFLQPIGGGKPKQ